MYFHVYLIYRFTRTFTDHSSVITRCWGFELQNGKSSLKSPQTLATQGFAPASFLSTPDTRTALFVEKRAVLFYLRNFIVVIKHLGWWLTTHSATDRKTRPPEFALQRSCCILAHFLFLFQPFFFPSDLRIHLLDQICQQSLAPSCRAPGKRC